jgi:Gram-negative bacterial TonB protein C-terminal
MKKNSTILVTLALLLFNNASAQFEKITGRVTDFMGNPVVSAVVSFKGSRNYRVKTDSLGSFTTIRNIVSDTVIACRHVSFKTVELKVENATTFNLKLYPKEEIHTLRIIADSVTNIPDLSYMLDEKRFVDSFRKSREDQIFTMVESDPYFDGGYDVVEACYRGNLRSEKTTLKYSVNGVVTVGFLIKKDGSVSDVRLVKGINKQIDDAVVKLTRRMPKWRPAMQNGLPCEYDFILSVPINIKVRPE